VSHIHRRMCEWDYTIDKSFVCLQSERRTSCSNCWYILAVGISNLWVDETEVSQVTDKHLEIMSRVPLITGAI